MKKQNKDGRKQQTPEQSKSTRAPWKEERVKYKKKY